MLHGATQRKRGDRGTAWENLVGTLEFSVHTESGDHVLGFAQNVRHEFRKAISRYDAATGTVTMDPTMYGRVAEINGQDFSARELRLSHCALERWREGADLKLESKCVVKLQDLRDAAAWAE